MGELRRAPQPSAPGALTENARGARVATWWWARVPPLGSEGAKLVFVHNDAHPDGTEVSWRTGDPLPAAREGAFGIVRLDELNMPTDVQLATDVFAPKAPPLWFVEVRELKATPPAVNLMAFTGFGVRAGRLMDDQAALELGIESSDQVAAVRWYPATGEVDQVYVSPEWRRLGIATALLYGAAMLAVARGWKRFWGDGQRTAMGEAMRNSSDWKNRAADLTHISPPMTPGEYADEPVQDRWINP